MSTFLQLLGSEKFRKLNCSRQLRHKNRPAIIQSIHLLVQSVPMDVGLAIVNGYPDPEAAPPISLSVISTSAPAAKRSCPVNCRNFIVQISKLNDVPPTAFFPFKSIPLQFTFIMEFVTLPAEVHSPIPKSPDWMSALSIS